MRTKYTKTNKINIVTLGCSKNIYDSEILMSQLKANNKNVVHEKDGNVVVINTCGFIENAKKESIDTILEYSVKKNQGIIDKLYVTGCLSERYKPELKKEIPNVDKYFGTTDLPQLLKSLGADYKHELIGDRHITPKNYAYLKISEGCDRPCSFCAIPLMRGAHRSKPMEEIVNEATELANKGVKELIIIAQDSTFYGLDLYKKRKLADLLLKLTKVEGVEWIRLHYAFPSGFPLDVLEVISNEKKVCSYIDIPLQHISNPILKSMRRGLDENKTVRLIKKIRDSVPEVAIRTTFILGYPGETEKDFKKLKNFVEQTRFERLGCFKYSHEENTHAYNLIDNVSEQIKQKRINEIMKIQSRISRDKNQNLVGKALKCVIDRKEGEFYIGRTEYDSPDVDNEVLVDAKKNYLKIGDFSNLRITSANDYDLVGEPL